MTPKPKAILPYQLRVDKENQLLALSFPHLEGQPYSFLTYQQASALAHTLLRILSEEGANTITVKETELDQIIRLMQDSLAEQKSTRCLLEIAFGRATRKAGKSHES